MKFFIAVSFFCSSLSSLHALDWPQFRGGDSQGLGARESSVPTLWSRSRNVKWKTKVEGKAWSSPVVVSDRVYITSAEEGRGDSLNLTASCYEAASGEEIWRTVVFEREMDRMHKKNSHASPTPIWKDGKLYVHFGHMGTACLDASDGKKVWEQTSLSYPPVHGTGGSPVVAGDLLVFSCDGAKDPFIVALRLNNGQIAWKKNRGVEVKRTFSFSTPLVTEVNGQAQLISPASGAVISYKPETGEEIWRCRYGEGYSVVPRPIHAHGLVYVSSGFDRAILLAIKPDGLGDVTDTHVEWKHEKAVPRESSPIVVGDLLYMNDDKGILTCFDAKSGVVHYQERLDGQGGYSASPVYANDHLYFHNGDGVTTVVKPGEKFVKVAENKIGEYGLSSFAVDASSFYIRTESELWKIGE